MEQIDIVKQVLNDIISIIETTTKKRKNTETNGIELLVALLIACDEITSVEHVIHISQQPSTIICDPSQFSKYKEDLLGKPDRMVNKIIQQFRSEYIPVPFKAIYLTGKSFKQFPEIQQLNQQIDHKKCKADIYIQLEDGSFIGYSIKESAEATKSNYSVQKLFGEEDNERLKQIKQDFLASHGFPRFNKSQRRKVNQLFYNSNNIYWTELKAMIEKHKQHILETLFDNLICADMPYPMYEFDGEKIVCLNDISSGMDQVSLEEGNEYYYKINGSIRECAKLFYRLRIPNKIYRVEIRWKGNIHGASPQFQMHESTF